MSGSRDVVRRDSSSVRLIPDVVESRLCEDVYICLNPFLSTVGLMFALVVENRIR